VRAPDDYGATYLADSSLVDLFDRARVDMPDWFADQVDRLSTPDLPPFSVADAVNDSDTSQQFSRERTRSQSSTGSVDDHPLSDVWGE
jgi:hypothetical protein